MSFLDDEPEDRGFTWVDILGICGLIAFIIGVVWEATH